MEQTSYRSRIDHADSYATTGLPSVLLPQVSVASAPAPFGALDAKRLSAPSGHHPLADIDLPELIAGPTPGLEGSIELDGPARVGEAISGRLHIVARKQIRARSAVLRLVGIRLYESTCSATRQGPNQTSETVSWVEVRASEVDSLPYGEPPVPAQLEPGQVIDLPFAIPAPRLGPPTAHAGVAAIAWALEAHWDIGMGADERMAAYVHVEQHPDLLRAGVLTLPSGAMNDSVDDRGASIAVDPLPPVRPGAELKAAIEWPAAPSGRSARVEVTLDVSGDASIQQVVQSVDVDRGTLAGATVGLPLPADLPPTLETPGLKVGYRIRVIVDRKLRSDESRERPVVVC